MKVEKSVIETMINHALQHSPIEACGYLAGNGDRVTYAIPLRNVDASEEHYSLDAKEQFETVRDLRKRNLRLMAVYHSHPRSPARMSEEDIRLAYDPDISYVIVSLDGSTTVKSFRLRNSVAEEEILEII
jgi:proteasome lid subunit RPN8/RPN11